MAYGKYNGYTNQTNTASSTAPLCNLSTVSTVAVRRLRMYEFVIGSDSTPADAACKYAWQRTTANFGTPTAVTPVAVDPGDPAALALFSAPGGTAPTITANSTAYQVAVNQRATYRWIAAPDSELIVPATTANGLALLSLVTSATSNTVISVSWQE